MTSKEMLLAERIAKVLNVEVSAVENAPFVLLMEKLVEVIENGIPNA